MIKIILLVSLFTASTYLGFQTSKVYLNKTKFYQELLEFSKNIKSEISFLKTSVLEIFSKYKFSSKLEDIKNQIYEAYKSNQKLTFDSIKKVVQKHASLDDAETNVVCQIFFELGNLGYVEQLERMDYYIHHFELELKKIQDKSNKMMPFCKKMGSLIGLLICIVLL